MAAVAQAIALNNDHDFMEDFAETVMKTQHV
jgi:hypothetical protein